MYSDYESDENGFYNLSLGALREEPCYHSTKIAAGYYLVFEATGPMPAAVIETWQRIWDYFKKESTYERHFISDFEAYHEPNHVAIHIGIKPPVDMSTKE